MGTALGQAPETKNKHVTRRDFLKIGGAVAAIGAAGVVAGVAAGEIKGNPETPEVAVKKVKYGMVIDMSRCLGCRACMEACKIENNTPEAVFWMYVFRFEEGEYPNVRVSYMPRQCQHCDNPSCVKVCPVGARFKREDGFVLTDFERCIGCRFCQVSCPYSVNYFNWKDPKDNQYFNWKEAPVELQKATGGAIPPYLNPDHLVKHGVENRRTSGGSNFKGVIGKCTWCVHRVETGLAPGCMSNCPGRVFSFGDLNDPNSEVSQKLKSAPSFRLAEEFGTEPRVYYLGTSPLKEDIRQLDAKIWRV